MDLHNFEQAPIVILATHLIEDISELCTQMALLNRGEVLEECDHESAHHD
jgi:ABC-type Na+ transport system ATPase subunit NatA